MQQQEMNRVRLDEMRGAPVYDAAGEKIGKVEEMFYDHQTSVPEWIGIGTGFFGTKRVLVPVKGAQVNDDGLLVAYPKDQVKDSPGIDSDEISQDQEAELSAFYGLEYSEQQPDTGLPEGRAESARGRGRTADEALTRSEEASRSGSVTSRQGTCACASGSTPSRSRSTWSSTVRWHG
jgi:sporulation protein YlmC with PRC-barrel domain